MANTLKKLTLALVTAGVALALTVSAWAQAQKVEKIEITGSNIKRVEGEGPLPIQVISRDDIERSAAATVGDLLRSMPVNTAGSFNETATNNQSGAAGISLRGLGQKSTLVLINGRRMANHAFPQGNQETFVDLNSLPKSAIERVEILKDGASAIYGSDAIAGVVNIILRRDYKGMEVGATSGKASEGNLAERSLNASFGFGDPAKDRYNVLGVIDYFERDQMSIAERKYLNGLDFRFLPGGSYFIASSGGTWVRPTGVTTGTARTPLTNCIPPSEVGSAGIISPFITGTACNYNVSDTLIAFPEAERLATFVRGTLDLAGGTTVFGELSYSQNKSNWINQPQTMTNSTVVFNPATGGFRAFSNLFPATFANNPYGRPAALNYTFFDVGNRTFDLKTDAWRALAGMSGTSGAWDWSAAAGFSESDMNQITGNQVDAAVLAGYVANPTGGGYNFLAPTAAQTATLRLSTSRKATSKLSFADLKASRELMQLPGGPLSVAVGLDFRRESLVDTPDAAITSGRLLGTGATATNGSRNAIAAFFEFSVPLSKEFELQLAGREDRYSDFGSAFSPKIGAKFTPVKNLLIRASAGKGFRAPTLPEITRSSSLGFANLTQGGVPTIIGVLTEASADLKAEKSESYSLGFVFEPTPSLAFSLDYYEIEQKNLVSENGVSFVVANEALFPGAVVRDPATGQILVVKDRYRNISAVETRGVDGEITWRAPKVALGQFNVRGTASYVTAYNQPAALGAPFQNFAGRNAGPNGLTIPRTRGKLSVDWTLGSFTATLGGNYTGRYRQRGAVAAVVFDTVVPSYTSTDLYVAYTGIKNLKLSLSVTNLEDRNPPIDLNTGVGPNSRLYDLRSRFTRVGIDYRFR